MLKQSNCMKIVFRVLAITGLLVGITAIAGRVAWADPYFNSAEPGCNSSSPNPTYLICDDFGDGTFITNNTCGAAENDGWCWTSNRSLNRGQSGAGAGGAAGFARATLVSGSDGSGGDGVVATHGFINNPSLTEIYVRMYIRFGSGYVFNSNQKFNSGQPAPHQGGVYYYGMGHNLAVMELCPVESCNYLNEGYIGQNQGNNINMSGDNHWYFIEYHVKLNTLNQRNGTWQMWINDCGTTGVCSGSPTLRASYTNILYNGSDNGGGTIGGYFMDIWGNPSDGGNLDFDQLIVSKSGPIGFMGVATPPPPPTAPPAPTALQVQP